jgi:flagellar biosynthesis protein FlhG
MLERVELLYRDRIGQILGIAPLSSRLARLLENLLFLLPRVDTVDQAMKELGDELSLMAGGDFFNRNDNHDNLQLFAPREKEEIAQVLRLLKEDNLSRSLRRIRRLLEELLEEEENSQRLFFMGTESTKLKSLDREVSLLLGIINDKAPRGGTTLRNMGGLLLFDFTLFKLFESSTVRKLIEEFIPWTEDERGRKRRDKQKQIRWLVEKDQHYREKYLNLLKTLRPVMVQQLLAIAGVLETDSILFKKSGVIHQEVYLRLLTSFLHDVLNSGLGVVIGFRYRPASRAFQKGAEVLLEELGIMSNNTTPGAANGT